MIIVLAPDDQTIVNSAKRLSYNNPEIYGKTYLYGDSIPVLGETEALFFIGHGTKAGSGQNAEIGAKDHDKLGLDGVELWDNFKAIMPDMYRGNVYIDACYSGDFRGDAFSLGETFSSQLNATFQDSSTYARSGPVRGDIPLPGDTSWAEA